MFFPRHLASPWVVGSWRPVARDEGLVLPVVSVLPVASGEDARTLASVLREAGAATVRTPVAPERAIESILAFRPDFAVHADGRQALEVLDACAEAVEPPTTRHLVARLRGRTLDLVTLSPLSDVEHEVVATWCGGVGRPAG